MTDPRDVREGRRVTQTERSNKMYRWRFPLGSANWYVALDDMCAAAFLRAAPNKERP